jgi:hypothetical protein
MARPRMTSDAKIAIALPHGVELQIEAEAD